MLDAAKNRQRDQLATGRRPLEQLGIGVGYRMRRLRGTRPVVVFDEFPDHPPNVGAAEEDEVVERVFA